MGERRVERPTTNTVARPLAAAASGSPPREYRSLRHGCPGTREACNVGRNLLMPHPDAPREPVADQSSDAAIPAGRVVAVGACVAAILALTVSAQTYFSMLGHGHSFRRMLLWQLSAWSFLVVAAPFVLRQGARLAVGRRARFELPRQFALGGLLTLGHTLVAAQLVLWFQPFVPVVSYTFTGAFMNQLPSLFAIDVVAYALLLVGGSALAAQRRARRLELRDSRLQAE